MILSGCFHNNGEYEAQNDGIKINDNYFIKESEDKDEQGNKIIYVWHEDDPIYRISFPLLEGYYYADENKYLDDHLLVLMESNENNNKVLLDTIKSIIVFKDEKVETSVFYEILNSYDESSDAYAML